MDQSDDSKNNNKLFEDYLSGLIRTCATRLDLEPKILVG
jgi:hypothetical protein